MDPEDKRSLRENRVTIVKDLEPRDVLSYLYEDAILTENDTEIISSGKTRRERCQLLLSMLPKRGPSAYGSFRRAIGADNQYHHLDLKLEHGIQKIESELSQVSIQMVEDTESRTSEERSCICDTCKHFFPLMNEKTELSKLCRRHCCLLLENIEPVDILDLHIQEHIISNDDCERIKDGSTSKERCKLLLQCLANSPDDRVVSIFKNSLKNKYSYILDVIDQNAFKPEQIHSSDNCPKGTDNSNIPNEYSSVKSTECKNKMHRQYRDCDQAGNVSKTAMLEKQETCRFQTFNNYRTRCLVMSSSSSTMVPSLAPKSREELRKARLHVQTTTPCNCQKNVVLDDSDAHTPVCTLLLSPGAIVPLELPRRRYLVTYNFLSTLINQGKYEKFQSLSSTLQQRYHHEPDMLCMLRYLNTGAYLFKKDLDSAKTQISSAFDIIPQTSNPQYFALELLAAKTRMYIKIKKLEKLRLMLDDAKMMIETNPAGNTGRAAGWLFINDARNFMAQIRLLNFRKKQSYETYKWLHNKAKVSLQNAMTHFQHDGSKDGPLGFGYAICLLVSLLLQCGDNGLTMGLLNPRADDMKQACALLGQIENSEIALPNILKMDFLVAKSDYQFRRGNIIRALEHAQSAYNIANELHLQEMAQHISNRINHLQTKTILFKDEINEYEFNQILLNESSSADL